jgi:hypothetical protein
MDFPCSHSLPTEPGRVGPDRTGTVRLSPFIIQNSTFIILPLVSLPHFPSPN